jgi:hypothetical protein
MADYEDEEDERKRRAGVGINIELEEKPRHQAQPANDHPEWISSRDEFRMNVGDETVAILQRLHPTDGRGNDGWRSHNVSDWPDHGWHLADFDNLEQAKETLEKWWDHARKGETYQPEIPQRPASTQEASRLEQPFAEREGVPFQPDERDPGRYGALRTEVTAEAIARDEWNAVGLDLPAEPDPGLLFLVAETASRIHDVLGERAAEALSVPGIDATTQQRAELWSELADRAAARHGEAKTLIRGLSADTPLTEEALHYDPWAAVYQPIPSDADAGLLQQAYGMAMHCADAVAGEPGLARSAYDPTLGIFGADQTREQNFERAVRRIDELDGRLHAAEQQQAPAETEFSHETIEDDPWTAVYLDIPVNADQALLKEAHVAIVECCQAVSRPPDPFDIYAPDNGQTPERNFANAVRRLDELGGRLRAAEEPTEPLTDQATQALDPQQQEPAVEAGRSDKAKLAEELLAQQGGWHSHYDIAPWQGGFAVFRIHEIEDPIAEQHYAPPTSQQVLGRADTLDQLHQAIIDGSALIADPQWVTDKQMNDVRNSQPLTLDDIAERVQWILDDPTREADELDPAVLETLQAHRAADIEATQRSDAAEELQRATEPNGGDEPEFSTRYDATLDAIEAAASAQELTDDAQVQYSRWTGQQIGAAGLAVTGRAQGGGGRGRSQSR